jgi:hypothetical protein
MDGIDLDSIRAALGFGPTEGEAWFSLPESIARFAPQKKDTRRAVILKRWGSGPIATLFPRSTSPGNDCEPLNPGHDHRESYPDCWLAKDARIVTRVPLQIAKRHLDQNARLCTEEDTASISAVLAAKL